MNCGFSDLFCCIQPLPSVTFSISQIECTGSHRYADVFLQVDRTFIHDSDYLTISKPTELNPQKKILITKEPGNLSGVSRVTFPDNGETFKVSYIRSTSHKMSVIGEVLVKVPIEQRESTSTDDTEDYSPMFRPSLNRKYMLS